MTKQIEETLNLPSMEEVMSALSDDAETITDDPVEEKSIQEKMMDVTNLKQMLHSLNLQSVALDDGGIDEIRDKALSAYKDMLDAGFNADSKYASNFLEPAVAALGIAMDSENTKLKKKLEYYRLKQQDEKIDLLRRKIELEEKRAGSGAEVLDDDSILMNRNELLKNLLKDK